MGFFPYDPEHPYYLQTEVKGKLNIKRIIAEQSWADPAAAAVDAIMAAETVPAAGAIYDRAVETGALPDTVNVIVSGTAGDVKAGNVVVTGTDADDQAQTENFLLTVNTIGTIKGAKTFKTITQVAVPAQDGAGVNIEVVAATTDKRIMADADIPAAGISCYIGKIAAQPDFARCVDLTLGGVAADTNAGKITVYGEDAAGAALSEEYTVTEDTSGKLAGAKAFKTVYRCYTNAQDGACVTLKIGVSDILGLNEKLSIDTVLYAVLNGTKEAVSPTVTVSATVLASNTVDLSSNLDGNEVRVGFILS